VNLRFYIYHIATTYNSLEPIQNTLTTTKGASIHLELQQPPNNHLETTKNVLITI